MNKQELIEMYQERITELQDEIIDILVCKSNIGMGYEWDNLDRKEANRRIEKSTLQIVVSDLQKLQFDNKPSWDDAPEWANWMAMDANGEWCWYENKPIVDSGTVSWEPRSGNERWSTARYDTTYWMTTLEQRPK